MYMCVYVYVYVCVCIYIYIYIYIYITKYVFKVNPYLKYFGRCLLQSLVFFCFFGGNEKEKNPTTHFTRPPLVTENQRLLPTPPSKTESGNMSQRFGLQNIFNFLSFSFVHSMFFPLFIEIFSSMF